MPDGVTVVEWIDKASPADRARYEAILLRSHLLILPTRADCFAIVVAEANAHGLPALVTDTGGMSGAITPGENGDLMAAGASPEEWADAIVRIVSDRQRYHGRCDAARNAYERRLNWSSWADSLQGVVRGLADR